MPLTLNIGHSRKIGESNYGSRGASVNLEVELEADLVRQPAQLHEKIRYLFRLAKESVEEELNSSSNGHADPEANGNGRQRPARAATQSQVRAIHAIADRRQIDLPDVLQQRFRVAAPDDLSISDASTLIDELKGDGGGNGNGNGRGGRR